MSDFTDFHQHQPGTLDLRVFDQTRWWVDRYATPHLISEMSVQYRRNVAVWLEQRREPYFTGIVQRRLVEFLFGESITPVAGSTDVLPTTADEWLTGTALFRCLTDR